MPETDSPICLYTRAALATSLLTSLSWVHVGFTIAYLRTTVEKEWEKDGGLEACPQKIFKGHAL